jgi:hypothetical protein
MVFGFFYQNLGFLYLFFRTLIAAHEGDLTLVNAVIGFVRYAQ